jgi:hypothetical protein
MVVVLITNSGGTMSDWRTQQIERESRRKAGRKFCDGKLFASHDTTALLETVIRPGDRVCLEGDNQKQADHLATALAGVDNSRVHDLHIVQSGVVLSAHLDLFTKGIATKLYFSYSGPQGGAIARALYASKIQLGAIHTYIELFARYFVDLTPHVALIAAVSADREGNLYTGPNTEDTPTIVEATHFKSGIVVAQVNTVVERVPRVGYPWRPRRLRRGGAQPLLRGAIVYARSGGDYRNADPHRDARNQGHLRRIRHPAPQPRFTEVGRARDRKMVDSLRDRGVIRRPEDLNIDPLNANRQLLAARSIKDLVSWSGGLYRPPGKFRNW